MEIASIRVHQATEPFDIAFLSGQAFRTQSESVILEMGYDNGMFSYGESAPRAYVTGETLSSVDGLIRDSFAPLLLHREIGKIEDVESILNELEDHCLQRAPKPWLSALGAVDIALLDGLGKLEKRPVSSYLGPLVNHPAGYSVSVPLLPSEQIRQLFHRFRHYPFNHVKVLVGDDLSWNADRLGLLRSLFGDQVDLRIEVNGKWSFEQAVAHARELKRFRISAVEQPLPARDIEGLRRFREETGMQVVADESFCTLSDAKRLVDSRACDILNIKISKCGGLLRAKAIADFALSAKVPCQLGAHVGETEILAAAGRHFAATTHLMWVDGGYSFLLFGGRGAEEAGPGKGKPLGPGLGLRFLNPASPSPLNGGPP
jgi:L-alanine-DL-glutamate epimerase-like enolase superfamily enzyme